MTGSYTGISPAACCARTSARWATKSTSSTDGTFINLPAAGVGPSTAPGDAAATLQGGSIIRTLSKLRIAGYSYNDGIYFNSPSNDACPYQRALDTNGECKSWGNPISEIYYEGLRYFAGQTAPTSTYHTTERLQHHRRPRDGELAEQRQGLALRKELLRAAQHSGRQRRGLDQRAGRTDRLARLHGRLARHCGAADQRSRQHLGALRQLLLRPDSRRLEHLFRLPDLLRQVADRAG